MKEDKMKGQTVIVLDCGATNIRAIAVDRKLKILSSKSFPNHTSPDPHFKGGLMWDQRYILAKLSEACKLVCAELKNSEIIGVCTTSFGVDGAPFNKNGIQLYPVISWACERTKAVINEVHEIFPLADLYKITGLNQFHFNTLYKLFWLKKNRKDIMEKMDHWLFMPAIISGNLCNALFTDITMAGTSMLCEHSTRQFSEDILSAFGLRVGQFPSPLEAGEIAGKVTDAASERTGLPAGIPVFTAGHDTQFAIFGSGAKVNEPVLSSGTWEILMVRTPDVSGCNTAYKVGITTELDAIPGLYNPGLQWLGSKHIEDLKMLHFRDIMHREDIYEIMVNEAQQGNSKRGSLFRDLLLELSDKTMGSLHTLEKLCGFKAESVILVGGGSKNKLWNKLRKEAMGIEVRTISEAESTVLGAAMFAFSGAGLYDSPEEARDAML